jgi:hypothetical protein
MIMTDTSQCSKRPASGALNGRLLAQKPEKGRIPSRPSSCTMRPCEKITLSTFPNADNATNTDKALSAFVPRTLRNRDAATRRLDEMISSAGTAAKYAMLTNMYRIATDPRARGAAILSVRTGFLVSESA